MIKKILNWYRKTKYRKGAVLSHFIAKDIRRSVQVVDDSEIESGFITVKTCTWNLLHASYDIKQKPDYGKPRRVKINELWKWQGELWGGSVPNGTDNEE